MRQSFFTVYPAHFRKLILLNQPMTTQAPMKLLALSIPFFLAACASSGVVQMGGDKMMISKNTAKFGGGISASAAAEVSQEAEAYCAERKKKVEVIDLQLSPGRAGSLGNVALQFKCS
jgi:predicted outer membrane repeat protein